MPSNNRNGNTSRFIGGILFIVICTVIAAVVSTVLSQIAFDEPSIVQEISVSVLLCAGALWALVLITWMRWR